MHSGPLMVGNFDECEKQFLHEQGWWGVLGSADGGLDLFIQVSFESGSGFQWTRI